MVMFGKKPGHKPENEQVCLVVLLQAWCQENASKIFEELEAPAIHSLFGVSHSTVVCQSDINAFSNFAP